MAARSSRAGGTNQIRVVSRILAAYAAFVSLFRAKVIDGRHVLAELVHRQPVDRGWSY